MKVRWLLIFVLFLQQKIYAAEPGLAAAERPPQYDKLTPAGIDKLNQQALNTYLADPTKARKLAGSALLGAKLINYKKGIGQSSYNIALTYWVQSYYPISLLYLDTALTYFGKKDSLLISDCYCHRGRNYTDLKDYKSAELFLNKAQQFAGADKKRSVEALSEKSYLYVKQKQFDKALPLITRSIAICRQLDDKVTLAVLYARYIYIYMDSQQYDKAINYCDTSIEMSLKVNNKRLHANNLVFRSNILLNQHKPADALADAQQALALADSLGTMDVISGAYNSIIDIYGAKGDSKQLLLYEKKYNAFQDERYTIDKQNSSQLIHDYFELNARIQSINQLKQNSRESDLRIKAQQEIITILFISLLLLVVALYIVWFYYRQKTALSVQLREHNAATRAQSQIIENQAHDLEELNNFKSKLLAIIGHDLRMPLNNLRYITDMFEEGTFSVEEVHMLMKSLNPVVRGAELTLANLLAWADGQIRGVKGVQATCIDLLVLIEEAGQICQPALDKKNIKLTHNASADSRVMADQKHLKVILGNLISNAIKFTEDSGSISIGVKREGDKIIISITDTGIGMSTEEMERLLSVNTHFSKPGTKGETGTGIGLLLCRELIELNGGKLWLNSQPGVGTTFYFSLTAC